MNSIGHDARERPSGPVLRPLGKPYKRVPDVRSVSLLGVGMVIGAVLGAGVALLAAPDSGQRTRDRLSRRVKGFRAETGVWNRLGRELKRAASTRLKAAENEAKLKRTEQKRDAPAKP